MQEEVLNVIIPICGFAIFLGAFIFVRITNPHNQKIETIVNPKDIFRKEICPYCRTQMKKKWNKRIIYGSETTRRIGYEKIPEFTCAKCNCRIGLQ